MGWVHNSLFYRLQTLYSLKSLQFNTVAWRHIAQDICAKFVTCMPHSQWWKDALELHHIQVGQPTIWCLKGTYVFKTDYRCLLLQHPHIVPNQPAPRSHAQIFARRHKEPKSQEVVCWCGFPWAAIPKTPGIGSLNNRAPQKCAHMLPISYIAIQYIARHGGF